MRLLEWCAAVARLSFPRTIKQKGFTSFYVRINGLLMIRFQQHWHCETASSIERWCLTQTRWVAGADWEAPSLLTVWTVNPLPLASNCRCGKRSGKHLTFEGTRHRGWIGIFKSDAAVRVIRAKNAIRDENCTGHVYGSEFQKCIW